MSFNNSFDFIFASPVVAITSVVSLACVGILAVKIGSDGDYPDVIETSAGYSSAPVLHLEAGNNQKQFEQDERSDSAVDNTARRALPSSNDRASVSQKKSNQLKGKGWQTNSDEVFSESGLTAEDYSSDTAKYNPPSLSIFSSSTTSTNSATTVSNDGASPNTNDDSTPEQDSDPDVVLNPDPIADPDEKSDPVEQACDVYPPTTEQVVQIDFDETQIISCQIVEQCGPPCLCTLTTKDGSGEVSETINNCG